MSDVQAAGYFFREFSSKQENGEIRIKNRTASITSGGKQICQNIKIQSIQSKKNVYLDNGFLFTLFEPLTAEQEKLQLTQFGKIIHWLELFSVKKAIVLSLLLVFGIVAVRIFLIFSADILVAVFPIKWEAKIGENSYNSIAKVAFNGTELPPKQISFLRAKASEIATANGLKNSEIYFHKSDLIGANALAFPGGPIVVTDELVLMLNDNELTLAVIAHELAHVQKRHSLHQIIEIVGVAAFASILLGSTDSLIEEASLVAINLWASKKSRQFEKEADLAALKYLETINLEKKSFYHAIEKLTHHECAMMKTLSTQNCLQQGKAGWFASHPSGPERLNYLTLKGDIK